MTTPGTTERPLRRGALCYVVGCTHEAERLRLTATGTVVGYCIEHNAKAIQMFGFHRPGAQALLGRP